MLVDGTLGIAAIFLDKLHTFYLVDLTDKLLGDVGKFTDSFPLQLSQLFGRADMPSRNDHKVAVDIGKQVNGHYHVIFLKENILITQVAKDTLAYRLPDIIVVVGKTGVAVMLLLGLFFGG